MTSRDGGAPKLASWWRRTAPRLTPLLSALWVAMCVFIIPIAGLFLLVRLGYVR